MRIRDSLARGLGLAVDDVVEHVNHIPKNLPSVVARLNLDRIDEGHATTKIFAQSEFLLRRGCDRCGQKQDCDDNTKLGPEFLHMSFNQMRGLPRGVSLALSCARFWCHYKYKIYADSITRCTADLAK